jgi:hypothetical protein
MSIRDFLRMYNVRMEFEHSHPVPLCEGDEFIMDALRIRGLLSPRDAMVECMPYALASF